MSKQCLRSVQIDTYIDLIKEGQDIVYLVSDSVSTSKVKPLLDLFPDRVLNVGIAEQNLIGIACGLANGNLIPVTGNAAPFLISRSNEQLKIDASYSNSNIKANGMHAGFSYGYDGVTHHEVNDISVIRGFPNFEIFVPFDPESCKVITRYGVLERQGPVYTSLNTGNFSNLEKYFNEFRIGEPLQVMEGNDLTIIALGTAIHDVIASTKGLQDEISPDVFVVSSIRPLNLDTIVSSIQKTGQVITVEQHSTHGGIGSIIAENMAELGLGGKLKRCGVPEGVYTENWNANDIKILFNLDKEGIIGSIRSFMK